MNRLIHGDNLKVLHKLESHYTNKIKLIYIDPPFSTKNVFRISNGRSATISSENNSDIAYTDTITGKEYLNELRERLIIAHKLLSNDGSIYVHIDCKVAYELKNVLDDIFNIRNFRNSITRIKSNPKNFSQNRYGNMKDTVLFYTKTDKYIWNPPRISPNQKRLNQFTQSDENGDFCTTPVHAPGETRNGASGSKWRGKLPPIGRHWRYSPAKLDELDEQGKIYWSTTGNPRLKIYAKNVKEKGMLLQDVWEFKDPQYPDYPTQKNLEMLKIIVNASSNRNDIVLDFYCGSGTTLLASAELGRRFIGIDKSEHAIKSSKKRLKGIKFSS